MRSKVRPGKGTLLVKQQPKEVLLTRGLELVSNPMVAPPRFGREEEVKLDPSIFRLVCENFDFYPKMDLFAS